MSSVSRTAFLGVLALILMTTAAAAHEVRPAYLELSEGELGVFEVIWKQPIVANRGLGLEAILPGRCELISQTRPEVTIGALTERSAIDCGIEDDRSGLIGQTITVGGLSRTLTDVLVRIRFADGSERTAMIKPDAPALYIDPEADGAALPAYLTLGIEHLLFGFDHILFVIGLMFFVHRPIELVKVVTAFTLAHSLTLALSTLGIVRLAQSPVEAIIALSILFLAVELLRPVEQRSLATRRGPWLVAFGFGLLHGFGFAGALSDIGLPGDAAALALLLFNLGVELGQLLVVAVLLLGLTLLRLSKVELPIVVTRLPVYAMGTISAYWFVERLAGIVLPR